VQKRDDRVAVQRDRISISCVGRKQRDAVVNQRQKVRRVAHVNLAVGHNVGKRGLHDGANSAPAAVLPRVRIQLLQLLRRQLGLQLVVHLADFGADQRRIVQNDLQLCAQGRHI